MRTTGSGTLGRVPTGYGATYTKIMELINIPKTTKTSSVICTVSRRDNHTLVEAVLRRCHHQVARERAKLMPRRRKVRAPRCKGQTKKTEHVNIDSINLHKTRNGLFITYNIF